MKQFKIYRHTDGRTEAVKQGWSWPAFFFGALWALCKKLWAIGFGVIAALIVITMITFDPYATSVNVTDLIVNLLTLASYFVFGALGNSWREANLLSNGYTLIGQVEAPNVDRALVLGEKIQEPNEPAPALQAQNTGNGTLQV